MLTHNLLVRASTAWSQWITRLNYTLLRDNGLQERWAFHIINLWFVREEFWSCRLHAPLLIMINFTIYSLLLFVLKYAWIVNVSSCSCFHVDIIMCLTVMFAYWCEWGLTILRDNQVKCSNLTCTRLITIMIVTPTFTIFAMAVLRPRRSLVYILMAWLSLGRSGRGYHHWKRFFVSSFWPFLLMIFFTSFKIIIRRCSTIDDPRSIYFHHLIFLTFFFLLILLLTWFLFPLVKLLLKFL